MNNERDNLKPHAEARLAMAYWGDEYGAQKGGCMDFWDGLAPFRQDLIKRVLDETLSALEANGRAQQMMRKVEEAYPAHVTHVEGWTGNKCEPCKGHGVRMQDGEERRCPDCAGTGDEYGPKLPPHSAVVGGIFPSKEQIHHLAKNAFEGMQREETADPVAWTASYERAIMAYRRLALSKQQASDHEAWERANEAVRAANALQAEVDQFRALYPSPSTNMEQQNYNCPCAHPSQCDDSCMPKTPSPQVDGNLLQRIQWVQSMPAEKARQIAALVRGPSHETQLKGSEKDFHRAANALLNTLWQKTYSGVRSHEENWQEMDRQFPQARWLHDELKAAKARALTTEDQDNG